MQPTQVDPCARCGHAFLYHYTTYYLVNPQYGCAHREDHSATEHTCCDCDGFTIRYVQPYRTPDSDDWK